MRILVQPRCRRRHAHCARGRSAQRGDTLGDQIYVLLNSIDQLVEQLMELKELWAFHIPVRLLRLAIKIKRVSEMLIEQRNHLFVIFRWKVSAGFISFQCTHRDLSFFHSVVIESVELRMFNSYFSDLSAG